MGLFANIGSALLGPTGGAIGGLLDSHHNNASIARAGADRIAGYDAGLTPVQGAMTDIKSILAPYTSGLGTPAAGKLSELLGLSGDTAGAMAGLKDNPVYKALFGNAQETVLQNASATGGLRGGNTQDALGHVGADTLAQVYQMMVGNLGNAAELGAKTGLGQGALENNNAGLQAQLQVGKGNAASDMVLNKIGLGSNNSSGSGSGSVGNSLQDIGQLFQSIQNIFGGGGGGASGAGVDWDAVHAAIPF